MSSCHRLRSCLGKDIDMSDKQQQPSRRELLASLQEEVSCRSSHAILAAVLGVLLSFFGSMSSWGSNESRAGIHHRCGEPNWTVA